METGHGGSSGRFEAIKDLAKEYAFILDLENIYDQYNLVLNAFFK